MKPAKRPKKPTLYLTQIADDRSLDGFKDFVTGMAQALGASDDGEDDMTEEEWVQAWREFWED